ncbi:MAG: DUF2789 domain-containing protein [Burkholderiales bacterium]|nr:DUF2789 domain-containing protein [Burkholderiales bacterium]
MNKAMHRFSDLFAQLGLPNDAASIADFVTRHHAISACTRLPDAPCWTPAQAQFLRESLWQDADWTGLVDQLSLALQGEIQPEPCGPGHLEDLSMLQNEGPHGTPHSVA